MMQDISLSQKEQIQKFDPNCMFTVEVFNDVGELVYLGVYDITTDNRIDGCRKSLISAIMPLCNNWPKKIRFEDCESEKQVEFVTDLNLFDFMDEAYNTWKEMYA